MILEVVIAIAAKYVENHTAKKLFPVARVRSRMLTQCACNLRIRPIGRCVVDIEDREGAQVVRCRIEMRPGAAIEAFHKHCAPISPDVNERRLRDIYATTGCQMHGRMFGCALVDFIIVPLKLRDPMSPVVFDNRFWPSAAQASPGAIKSLQFWIGRLAAEDSIKGVSNLRQGVKKKDMRRRRRCGRFS